MLNTSLFGFIARFEVDRLAPNQKPCPCYENELTISSTGIEFADTP